LLDLNRIFKNLLSLTQDMSKLNFPKLIFSIFICQMAGIIGSLFTFSAIPTWYVYYENSGLQPVFSV